MEVLDALAAAGGMPIRVGKWEAQPVLGGRNNRLFHVTGPDADLAVKFYRVDARDRAGREFQALSALHACGLEIAPRPLLLDRQRYAHPVMAQTWMEGQVYEGPPDSESAWQRLAEHYNTIHSFRYSHSQAITLPKAFMTFQNAQDCADLVLNEIATLPTSAKRPDLLALARRLEQAEFPSWPMPPFCLSRCDPSTSNLIRREGEWASVDWEYAGWGDPAFETGDLMTHPHYRTVSQERWDWFLGQLEEAVSGPSGADPNFGSRARCYSAMMLARWAGVFARYWSQRDSGRLDPDRLGQFPTEWWAALPDEYEYYRARAETALNKEIFE